MCHIYEACLDTAIVYTKSIRLKYYDLGSNGLDGQRTEVRSKYLL